jgi:glycerate 2-kinase
MTLSNAKQIAVDVFRRTLAAIDVEVLFKQRIHLEGDVLVLGDGQRIGLEQFNRIFIVGIGKASLKMGKSLERLLGDRITKGVLVTDRPQNVTVNSEVVIGSHPTPNEKSLVAGRRVMNVVSGASHGDLIIFLISGGGSALIEVPLVPGVAAADLAELGRVLVTSKATIHEINVVRKHLSLVKGGRLGGLAPEAACVAIYISDVNADDLRSIASNPILLDSATLDEFYEVVAKYDLVPRLPEKYGDAIKSRLIPELPRGNRDAQTYLLSDNSDAVNAAATAAKAMGFATTIFDDLVEGPYQEIADELISQFGALVNEGAGKPLCAVSGGEVVCPVHGSGTGGRNQEFVLYSASKLASHWVEHPGSIVILSCGTDGIDGNSEAAGAVADDRTIEEARSLGLDYISFLENNDSFSFFRQAGGLVVTGPTGNNVRDVRLMISGADRLG